MLNRTTLVLVVGVTLLSSLWISPEGTPAQAAEEWGWFSAVSAVDKWYVSQGKASVDVSGKRLTAKLLRDDGTVHIVLSGTLQNGQLTVTATEMESDSPPRRLQGNVETVKWVDGAGGRRSVLLVETGVAGGLVIGLTKETK